MERTRQTSNHFLQQLGPPTFGQWNDSFPLASKGMPVLKAMVSIIIGCIKSVWPSTIIYIVVPTMFRVKTSLVGGVSLLIFVLNLGVWFEGVPIIPEGVSSQMVGRDVWCSYMETTHRLVERTNSSMPQLGKTHPKMEAKDFLLWCEVSSDLQKPKG